MKPLTVIASAAIALAFVASASAQRGGAARGGFSARSAPSFHSNFAPSAHYSGPAYRYSGPAFSASRVTVAPGARSSIYSLRRPTTIDRRRPYAPRVGIAAPYGYPGIYAGYGDYGYIDPGYTDAAPYDDASTQPMYPDPEPQPEVEQQQAAPPPASNRRRATPPQPAPAQEDTVTLVFKDGRPSEQIHNYMLTRTMLYVRDQNRRDIPVDQLDLVATKKANQANGVEFALPSAK